MSDYKKLEPFRFWCQKVLPLTYDDSLSYYELLCKVVEYLNYTMADVDYLHDYMENYFSSLDVQTAINKALDTMAKNGTLDSLLQPIVSEEVTDWLDENVTQETGYVLDKSLTIEDAGADAKATGTRINNISSANRNLIEIGTITREITDTSVTLTQNKEAGTVAVSGNASENLSLPVVNDSSNMISVSLSKDVTYTLSGCPANGSPSKYALDLREEIGGVASYIDYGKGITFTPSTNKTMYLYIQLRDGYGNNLTFKPMLAVEEVKTEFIAKPKKSARDDIAREFMETFERKYMSHLKRGGIVNELLKTGYTYIDNNSHLTYGQKTAIHWYESGVDKTTEKIYTDHETPTEIDCSSLAWLIMQGVDYYNSRYCTDNNYILSAGYGFDPYGRDETEREANTGQISLSYNFAKWCHDNGYGIEIEDGIGNIQAGDILFFSADTHDQGAWKNIDHCEILIDVCSNYSINYDYPSLITLNCTGDRDDPVAVNLRYKTFFDGTNVNHRKLVYAGRIPYGVMKSTNEVIIRDNDKNYTEPIFVGMNQYHICKVEFDGTITEADTHFTIYLDGTARYTFENIETGRLNQKLHYIALVPMQWDDVDTIKIANYSDTSAVIENIVIANGIDK